MAIDFPSNPTVGQVFQPGEGLPVYTWNGTAWASWPTEAPNEAPNDNKTYGRKNLDWVQVLEFGAVDAATLGGMPASSFEQVSRKGSANGYPSLDGGGRIPAAQLPSYVDDVVEYANLAAFPVTGSSGIIYVALDTNRIYRWSGSAYMEISGSPGSTDAVPEGGTNLYHTTARAAAAAPVQSVAGRGGAVVLTKADVGLSSVDNTSDVNKPVSTAQAAAIALKADLASPVFTGNPQLTTTPTAGDNDMSIANTAFVMAAVTAAGAIAPSNANPAMNGTAAPGVSAAYSRGDHVHPVDTSRAPVNSPAFSGTPTVPTAGAGTNTTQAASTQFVTGAIATSAATKEPTIAAGTTAQYWRGDKSWQTLPVSQNLPVATIILSANVTPDASFWVKCNGAALSRTTYATLYAQLGGAGSPFGQGDGTTTFNVPDLRGEFVRGWDDARGIDVGRNWGSAQGEAFLNHNHTASLPNHSHGIASSTAYSSGTASNQPAASAQQVSYNRFSESVGLTPTVNASTAGGAETRPRNIALAFFIKYQ